jgi:hypothetical protein
MCKYGPIIWDVLNIQLNQKEKIVYQLRANYSLFFTRNGNRCFYKTKCFPYNAKNPTLSDDTRTHINDHFFTYKHKPDNFIVAQDTKFGKTEVTSIRLFNRYCRINTASMSQVKLYESQ